MKQPVSPIVVSKQDKERFKQHRRRYDVEDGGELDEVSGGRAVRARSRTLAASEQGFRACIGILRLVRSFGSERLEAAAARAIDIGALSYGSVRSILDHKLDRQAAPQRAAGGAPIVHGNIRGPCYYH
jgi:transposase